MDELLYFLKGFPDGSNNKESACSARDQVQSLGWKDPLEKEMATHSIILAWRIPRTEDPGGLQSRGLSDMTDQLTHTHKEVAVAVRCSPEAEITGCRALSLCSSEQKSNDQSTVGTMQGPPWGSLCSALLSCFSCVRLFATLWTVARQASLSIRFSR